MKSSKFKVYTLNENGEFKLNLKDKKVRQMIMRKMRGFAK